VTVAEFVPGLKRMRVFAITLETPSVKTITTARIFIPILFIVGKLSSISLITNLFVYASARTLAESSCALALVSSSG
jgi:hypothetical protein